MVLAFRTVRTRARRTVDGILLLAGGLLLAGAAASGAAVADRERVRSIWAGAQVDGAGNARVVEAIDYDFGTRRRHGIVRDVPGLSPTAKVSVSSATAPADVQLQGMGTITRIQVGDPDRTITGRHRYRIAYPLRRVAPGRRLAWNPVGTDTAVPTGKVEVHTVAPFAFTGARCVQGKAGATRPCSATQPEPGHLVVTVDSLAAHEGVTLYATAGRALGDTPALPAPPAGTPADAGSGLLLPALLAGAAALVAAVLTAALIRRAGRESVAPGDTGAAPWGDPGSGAARVDAAELASLAAPVPAPPSELTPAQGGVVLTEQVRKEHKVAWLLTAAARGDVDVQENAWGVVLARRGPGDAASTALLDLAFNDRRSITLGTYDQQFAALWSALGDELAAWQQASGLWDPAGRRRQLLAFWLGVLGVLLGLAAAVLGGVLASGGSPRWQVLAVAGGLLGGAGVAALVRGWELRVRTPAGTRLWLQVEGFRRFLAGAQASSVGQAAHQGPLGLYAAWAVALGEMDSWSKALATSRTRVDPGIYYYSRVSPLLLTSALAASREPSSSGSGSGGGFGGGVGGGAGGGGVGSW